MTLRSGAAVLLPMVVAGLLASAGGLPDDTGVLGAGVALPEPGVSRARVLLRLDHRRQEHNLCVLTSAAMVLAYYGDPREPRELKVRSRGRAYDRDAPFDGSAF